jgi:hypothetical protein
MMPAWEDWRYLGLGSAINHRHTNGSMLVACEGLHNVVMSYKVEGGTVSRCCRQKAVAERKIT